MTSLETEIGDLMNQVVSAMRRDVGRRSAKMGLSRSEWAVLRFMHYDGLNHTVATVATLLPRVHMAAGQLSDVLDGLVHRGFARVCGTEHPAWELTEAGRRMAVPVVGGGEEILSRITGGLTDEEMVVLVALLRRVRDTAREMAEESGVLPPTA